MSLLQTALAPTGPSSSSSPKSAPGFCADPEEPGCPGGLFLGQQHLPSTWGSSGARALPPKVGHAVSCSDVVGRAKDPGGAIPAPELHGAAAMPGQAGLTRVTTDTKDTGAWGCWGQAG